MRFFFSLPVEETKSVEADQMVLHASFHPKPEAFFSPSSLQKKTISLSFLDCCSLQLPSRFDGVDKRKNPVVLVPKSRDKTRETLFFSFLLVIFLNKLKRRINTTSWRAVQVLWNVKNYVYNLFFSLSLCRHLQLGAILTCVKPALESKTSKMISATVSSWCFCWKSSLAKRCPNPIGVKCASTRSPTSTRPSISSPAKESSSFPSELKVIYHHGRHHRHNELSKIFINFCSPLFWIKRNRRRQHQDDFGYDLDHHFAFRHPRHFRRGDDGQRGALALVPAQDGAIQERQRPKLPPQVNQTAAAAAVICGTSNIWKKNTSVDEAEL